MAEQTPSMQQVPTVLFSKSFHTIFVVLGSVLSPSLPNNDSCTVAVRPIQVHANSKQTVFALHLFKDPWNSVILEIMIVLIPSKTHANLVHTSSPPPSIQTISILLKIQTNVLLLGTKACGHNLHTLFLISFFCRERPGKQGLKYEEVKTRTATYYRSALPYLTRLLNNQ